jgi:hypothetical protein
MQKQRLTHDCLKINVSAKGDIFGELREIIRALKLKRLSKLQMIATNLS